MQHREAEEMRELLTVLFLACTVLQASTAQAQYEAIGVEIDGIPCDSCLLTELPNEPCMTPSQPCPRYQYSSHMEIKDKVAFTVRDQNNVFNHWFSFWNNQSKEWELIFGNSNITRTTTVTPSGTEIRVEHDNPNPSYFSSGEQIPVFRATRFNIVRRCPEETADDMPWVCGWFPADQAAIEIWAAEPQH